MESLFIEIDKDVFGTSSNIVIGVIYRMPDSSVDTFSDRMNDVLNTIQNERKLYHILGDLNIDFLKHDEHRPTSTFLDVLYTYNVFPVISKPTRVTKNTAILIDHILTNNFDVSTNHLLRSAERKYYHDLLIQHKSNMKKSWNVFKMVINKRKYRQCCTRFVSNGETLEDGKLIANKFNDFL